MTDSRKKSKIDVVAILLVLMLVVLVGVLISSIFSTIEIFKMPKKESNAMPQKASRMSLTGFDREFARQLMDQNNDGRCDICGMPIEQCIDSGQLECSMDTNAKIGILGSQHIHADFKVFISGKEIDFADKKHYMKSSFIHLDDSQNKQDASGVLHMHATGVPLWLFFKSLGIEIPNTMNLYVNGKLNPDGLDYMFKDLDKLLLTDATDQATINQQLSTITDYAKQHSKPGASS